MSAPRVCCECKREYGRVKGTRGLTSHGVCPECLPAFRRRMPRADYRQTERRITNYFVQADAASREFGATVDDLRLEGYEVSLESSDEAVVEIEECPACGGPLMRLGDPGRVSELRCRNCGVVSHREE